ncbi:MAG: hypothetical protein JSV03_04560, partial [Planctomycetota bacterium]
QIGTYEFPGDDGPVQVDGKVITPAFQAAGGLSEMTPSVTVMDQEIVDGTVTIAQVISDGPGWIVIHADQDGKPGPVLGQTAVQDGENADIVVALDLNDLTGTCADLPSYPLSISRFLADKHIPHTIIIERDLKPEQLAEYNVLVLPEVRLLSELQAKVITNFVRSGKGLIVFGPAGTRNKYNEELSQSSLGELLEKEGRVFGNLPYRRNAGQGRVAWFPSAKLPVAGRRPLPELSLKELRDLPETLNWAGGDVFSGSLDAPEMVELNLMKSPDGRVLLAHLMNYNIELPAKVTPYDNIRLEMLLPGGAKVERVVLLSPDLSEEQTELQAEVIKRPGGRFLVTTIPHLEIYNLVAVVLEDAKLSALPNDCPIPVTLKIKGPSRVVPGQKVVLEIELVNRSEVQIEGAQIKVKISKHGKIYSAKRGTLREVIHPGNRKSVEYNFPLLAKSDLETHHIVDVEAELSLSTGKKATVATQHRVLVTRLNNNPRRSGI